MANQISAQLKAKLRKAREKFAKAEPAESNSAANRKVPDGTYTAKVVGLEFAEFGKHAILRFTFEVTDADKKAHETAIGQLVETRFNLDTDEGPAFIKRDFAKFGYDDVNDLLDDPDASLELFTQLLSLNPVVKINVAMDDTDQWQNVFLNDVLEMDDAAEEEEEEEEAKEEKPKKAPAKKEKVKEEPKKEKAKSKAPAKKEEPDEEEEEEVDEADDEESADEDDGTDEDEESAEEESEESESSDERELEVGDMVEVPYKGKEVAAIVVSIDETNSTVKVQIDKKRVVVPLENVFLLEG